MINSDTLLRLRERDLEAFERVVHAFQHEMLCVATRIIGQQADAEEVRQQILLRIWQSPQGLPNAEHFSAWLRRCVINESISLLRKKKREHRLQAEIPAESQQVSNDQSDLDVEQLRVAMQQLDAEQRALLALRFDQQLTVREIGQVFQQSHSTIQSKLERAIKSLRSLMQIAGDRT